MENTKLIISRRLIMRKFEKGDLEKDLEFMIDPKFFYMSEIKDKQELVEKSLEYYKNKKNFNFWHIVKKGTNHSIGVIKAIFYENGVRLYVIINKSYRNRGYGKESLDAVIEHFFSFENVKEIYLKTPKDNKAFKTIIDKIHFKKYDEDIKYLYYKMDNLDYMKYFAIFGEI
mgnify:CR=1 FL=1